MHVVNTFSDYYYQCIYVYREKAMVGSFGISWGKNIIITPKKVKRERRRKQRAER